MNETFLVWKYKLVSLENNWRSFQRWGGFKKFERNTDHPTGALPPYKMPFVSLNRGPARAHLPWFISPPPSPEIIPIITRSMPAWQLHCSTTYMFAGVKTATCRRLSEVLCINGRRPKRVHFCEQFFRNESGVKLASTPYDQASWLRFCATKDI